MKDLLFFVGISAFVVLFFAGLFWALSSGSREDSERRAEEYAECRAHTADVEWCVKTVYNVSLP